MMLALELTTTEIAIVLVLQLLTLAYVHYGFSRVARNQVRLEEYLKQLTEKDE